MATKKPNPFAAKEKDCGPKGKPMPPMGPKKSAFSPFPAKKK